MSDVFNHENLKHLNDEDVLDIDEVIKLWAQQMMSTNGRLSDNLVYEIHWNRSKIYHRPPSFNDVTTPSSPTFQTLFKSSFRNETNEPQENSFHAERESRALAEMTVQQGVCFSDPRHSVAVVLPKPVVNAGTDLPRELSVCERETRRWEEKMSWSVDTTINVEADSSVKAKLLLEEHQWSAEFSVETYAQGPIRVVVKKANGEIVSNLSGDLAAIFRKAREMGLTSSGLHVSNNNIVHFVTTGNVNFRYGVEQHVEVGYESDD